MAKKQGKGAVNRAPTKQPATQGGPKVRPPAAPAKRWWEAEETPPPAPQRPYLPTVLRPWPGEPAPTTLGGRYAELMGSPYAIAARREGVTPGEALSRTPWWQPLVEEPLERAGRAWTETAGDLSRLPSPGVGVGVVPAGTARPGAIVRGIAPALKGLLGLGMTETEAARAREAGQALARTPVSRAVSGGLAAGVGLLSRPAITSEALVGRGLWAAAPTGENIYVPPGAPRTPELIEQVRARSEAARATGDRIRALDAQYGDDPAYLQARWQGFQVAWSGPAAMAGVVERAMAGEDPETARYGDANAREPVRANLLAEHTGMNAAGDWEITAESLPAFERALDDAPAAAAYFAYATGQGQDPLAVATRIVRQGVPGEANPVLEFIGQVVVDPLNLLGVGAKGRQARFAEEAAADALVFDARSAEEVFEAAGRVEGLGLPAQAGGRVPVVRWLLERTPQAKRGKILDESADLLRALFSSIADPDDQVRAVGALVDLAGDLPAQAGDAARAEQAVGLLDTLGWGRQTLDAEQAAQWGLREGTVISPLESNLGRRVSYFLRQVFSNAEGEFQPRSLGRILRAAESPDQAVFTLLNRMSDAATTLYPVEEATGLGRVGRGVVELNNKWRGFCARYLHMGYTLGYAIRNAIQNAVHGAVDGVLPFDSAATIDKFFDAVGYTPSAVARGLGGGPAAEYRAAQGAAQGWQRVTRALREGPAIQLSAAIEDFFGKRAVYAGMRNTWTRYWAVGRAIPEAEIAHLADVLGTERAGGFLSDVLRARNPLAIDDAVRHVLGEGGYVELWRTLQPEHMQRLGEFGAADEVADVVRAATSPADFRRSMDAMRAAVWARGRELAEAGEPVALGTEVARALELIEEPLGELPRPLKVLENFEAGRGKLAQVGALLSGARNEAAYYAARAGLADDFIGTYESLAQSEMAMRQAITAERTVTARAYAALPEGATNEATRLWADYGEFGTETASVFFEEVAEAYHALTRNAKAALFGVPPETLRYPAHVDDVARVMGITPETAGVPDWERVAQYAEQTGNDLLAQMDEFGRRSAAELEAGRLPELGQVGGQEALVRKGRMSFAQIQARIEELAGQGREVAESTVDWALRQAGILPDELAHLTTQQRVRLVQEIGSGTITRTAGGRVARIGPLTVERRETLMRNASDAVQTMLGDIGLDATTAPAYHWLELADEARRYARGEAHVVRNASTYDAAGYPILRGIPQVVEDDMARIAALLNDGHAPTATEIANAAAPEVAEILDAVEADVLTRWGRISTGEFDADQVAALRQVAATLGERNNAMRVVSTRVGQAVRDFAYLNYADKRNVDMVTGLFFMYPFWYTRTYGNWVRRLVDQPALLAGYGKMEAALGQINAGLPDWWKDQIGIRDATGEGVYIPLQATFNPLYGLMDDYRSPERERTTIAGLPVGRWVEQMGSYGPSANTLFQFVLAGAAYAEGDTEAAKAWLGYQSQWSRALPALSALARDWIPGAEQVIPPGGVGAEPWLYQMTDAGLRFQGSIYDQRRIGGALGEMMRAGQIGEVDATLAAYFMSGPFWDQALQQQAVQRAAPTVISWLAGAGFKPRREYEMELSAMWDARNALRQARDAGQLTADEYSAGWQALRERWPEFTLAMMVRSNPNDRDELLAWDVLNRLPPGWQRTQIFEEQNIQDLVGQFYDGRGDMSGWSDDDRRQFMAGIIRLAGEIGYPSEEQGAEYEAVATRNAQVEAQAAALFGADIADVQAGYFAIPDLPAQAGTDTAARQAYLQRHPQLGEYWDFRDRERRGDPLLRQYYVKPPPTEEEIGQARREHLGQELAYRWPEVDIYELQAGYFAIDAKRPAERRHYLEAHPEVKEYWGLRAALSLSDPQDPHQEFIFAAYDEAERRWPGIRDTQDEYFRVKAAEGREAARAFLREHAELRDYWDLIAAARGPAREYAAGGPEEEEETTTTAAGAGEGRGTSRSYGRAARVGGGGGRAAARAAPTLTWDGLIAGLGADLGVLPSTSLTAYFSQGIGLPAEVRSRLEAVYTERTMGYATFEEWLDQFVRALWAAWLTRTGFVPMRPSQPFVQTQRSYSYGTHASRRVRGKF